MDSLYEKYELKVIDDKVCLNDLVEKVISSKNPNDYYKKISCKKVINGSYYVNEDEFLRIVKNGRSEKCKEIREYLKKKDLGLMENINDKIDSTVIDIKEDLFIFMGNVVSIVRDEDNEPWFKGNDVTKILEYSDSDQSVRKFVDETDKRVYGDLDPVFASGSKSLNKFSKKAMFINESGMYSLIFKSEMKEAKKFQKWVTSEVLPSIRKTGKYIQHTIANKFCGYDLEPYHEKYCAYILNIGNGLYKFGRTADIRERFGNHKHTYPGFKVVKIFTFIDYNNSKKMEYALKSITKRNKIRVKVKGKGIELFEPTDEYKINDLLEEINDYCSDIVQISSDKSNNKTLCEKSKENDDEEDKLKYIHDSSLSFVNKLVENNVYKDNPEKYAELFDKYTNEYKEEVGKLVKSKNAKIKAKKPIDKNTLSMTNKCVDCGVAAYKTSERCNQCESKRLHFQIIKDKNRPSLETLRKDIAETSYVATGKKYGVSDNCIRKWINKYEKYGSG